MAIKARPCFESQNSGRPRIIQEEYPKEESTLKGRKDLRESG